MTNPYKVGTQKWFLLELYRRNNYKVRASQTHQKIVIGDRSTFLQSPTKRESELRQDGFEFAEPRKIGDSKDRLHEITYDPFNTKHSPEAVAKEIDERPVFGKNYCAQHKRQFSFQEKCWDCVRVKLAKEVN